MEEGSAQASDGSMPGTRDYDECNFVHLRPF